MIKINKDLAAIPKSLRPAYHDLFPDFGNAIPLISQTTHDKRLTIIASGEYLDNTEYNNRYKTKDVRESLIEIYNHKCAFCEQRVEQYHVEHYRPKASYYWLAFSWDNLIMACATCNQKKGENFAILGIAAVFINTENNLRAINSSSSAYDNQENPLMVNPEVTDPEHYIQFDKSGKIFSADDRFKYTIDKCEIDRKYLNDDRRTLLDIFERDISSMLVEANNAADQLKAIGTLVKKFVRDTADPKTQYCAFRNWAIAENWLADVVKNVLAVN